MIYMYSNCLTISAKFYMYDCFLDTYKYTLISNKSWKRGRLSSHTETSRCDITIECNRNVLRERWHWFSYHIMTFPKKVWNILFLTKYLHKLPDQCQANIFILKLCGFLHSFIWKEKFMQSLIVCIVDNLV